MCTDASFPALEGTKTGLENEQMCLQAQFQDLEQELRQMRAREWGRHVRLEDRERKVEDLRDSLEVILAEATHKIQKL